jgi:high-affinity iron transporter
MNLPLWIRIVPLLVLITASPGLAADEAKRLTALIDYIGGDYKNAVQEGKVVNPDEYQEMLEFAARSLELLQKLKADEKRDSAGIEPLLLKLASEVRRQGDPKVVAQLAQQIKGRLIAAYKIATHPRVLPTLTEGKSIYTQNCAQCHGESGRGDGPSAATMQPKEPPPANFTDADRMSGLSPFKAFNTTSFGIDGTAMPNFSALSEDERWQVAFYIFSLRFSGAEAKQGKTFLETKKLPDDLTSVAALATLSDEELEKKLQPYLPVQADRLKVSAYLRRGLLEEKKPDPLLTARTLLRDSMALYEQGEREKAYQKAVEAYLDGFELAEPLLFARDASFGRSLEARFTRFRSLIKAGADVDQVRKLHDEIDTELIRASQLSTGASSLTGGYLFLNAALIILREGLEAALVLAAILALLKVMGAKDAVRYIHLGWILAVAAGILTWFLSSTVLTLSGAQRESMEGLVTLFAALVLFYVGYWLHTKSEAKKWQQFIQAKVQEALSTKGILALVGVSFFAVYREAFEVVLFYQALWLQSPDSPTLVIWGFVAGLAALTVLVFAILKLGLKMPLKYFFGAAGALLYLLAFVMTGKGVKALQAAGWFSETPLQNLPQIPFLGIYPTLETVVAQGLLLLALIAALFTLARERRYEVTSR